MTEHDQRDGEAERPKIRIVDKRRYREGGGARADGGAEPATEATASTEVAGDGSEDELVRSRAQTAEYRDHLQRLQAEFENYRKRITTSQQRLVDTEVQRFVTRLLEVLDEFDLALIAAERSPDFESFRRGVELVYAKLAETLRSEGLERIDAEGKPFDPNEHEALMQTGDAEGEPHVAEVFRQGYRLRGAVIRPSSVRVERK